MKKNINKHAVVDLIKIGNFPFGLVNIPHSQAMRAKSTMGRYYTRYWKARKSNVRYLGNLVLIRTLLSALDLQTSFLTLLIF